MSGDASSTEELKRQGDCQVRSFRVQVLAGSAAPTQLEVEQGTTTHIGSSKENSIVIDDPAVSRFHLRLRADEDAVSVEDLGSTNGSFVGGAQFRRVSVRERAEISLGHAVIAVEVGEQHDVEVSSRERLGRLFGCSGAMRRVFRDLAFAAKSRELSVLLLGETGTGKEVAARTLHEIGPRSRAPFVAVDCASLSPSLIEGQLFGHVKGAFTDAKAGVAGPFERADGGTVFLDEIGELPLPQQAKLLRVLQEREVTRVGSTQPVSIDIKVVAATRRDLFEEMNAGRFREDLYFRLAGEEIEMPPLRERPADIPLLVECIVDQLLELDDGLEAQEVPPDVIRELQSRPWPGNVRELRHCLHRYLLRGELAPPRTSHRIRVAASRLAVADLLELPYADAVREFEERFVQQALEQEDGHQARAAKRLGVNRSTLYRILQRSEVDP